MDSPSTQQVKESCVITVTFLSSWLCESSDMLCSHTVHMHGQEHQSARATVIFVVISCSHYTIFALLGLGETAPRLTLVSFVTYNSDTMRLVHVAGA